MKKAFALLLLMVSIRVVAQSYPVSGITIVMPANPDASISNWSGGAEIFTVTATAKPVNGRIDGRVEESKILVTIKKGGVNVCGTYTPHTAPASNFNAATKVWSGRSAISLLGQDCTLPTGDYEMCVQFFGGGPAEPRWSSMYYTCK